MKIVSSLVHDPVQSVIVVNHLYTKIQIIYKIDN